LTSKILTEFKQQIQELKLVPAGGGAFEVSLDNELIYSKLKTGKFPDEAWILDTVRQRLR
jgi:selenoprotein W-related protein